MALFLVAFGGGGVLLQRGGCTRTRSRVLEYIYQLRCLWTRAGMRYKLKTIVGLWQCLGAVPSVYDVVTPSDLERYTRWVNVLKVPEDFGIEVVIPGTCLGSYLSRLIIGASWPIAVIAIPAAGYVAMELARDYRNYDPNTVAPRATRVAIKAGLERALPFMLIVTFVVVPSTGTRIFKTFLCDSFAIDETTSKLYLQEDLSLACDSPEYQDTKRVAIATLFVWPIGVGPCRTRTHCATARRTALEQPTPPHAAPPPAAPAALPSTYCLPLPGACSLRAAALLESSRSPHWNLDAAEPCDHILVRRLLAKRLLVGATRDDSQADPYRRGAPGRRAV